MAVQKDNYENEGEDSFFYAVYSLHISSLTDFGKLETAMSNEYRALSRKELFAFDSQLILS